MLIASSRLAHVYFTQSLPANNLLVFGADVSNAFAEALPPKQPFYIKPEKSFCEWWVLKLK
jgi:hypothetical protein